MELNLYSFIASRAGEVFTAQLSAPDLNEACLAWGKHFTSAFQQKGFDPEDFLEDLAFKVEMMPPAPIEKNESLWCFSFVVMGKVMWVHIVQTAPALESAAPEITQQLSWEPALS